MRPLPPLRLALGAAVLGVAVLALPACRTGNPDGERAADAERAATAPRPGAPDGAGAAAPDTAFDARAWLRAAAAVWDSTTWAGDYDAAMALSRRHADALGAAVAWKQACAEPWEGDWTPDEETGFMALHPLGGEEHLVEVTCEFAAYQGSYVLVHLEGPHASILRAPSYDYEGARIAEGDAVFSTVWPVDAAARTFATFAKARGIGDCGTFTRYRVGRGAEAAVVEVRARDCPEAAAEDEEPPDPETWPVVYREGAP